MTRFNPKPKVCPVCGEKFKPERPLQAACSPKCAYEYIKPKNVDKRVKEMKVESMKLSDLRFTARSYFQQWIRERDKALPCISCDRTEGKWDAGHYLKAEIYTGLIFDESNVWKQCSYCNLQLEGNAAEYRPRLIKRIGLERVEQLEARKDQARMYKFSKQELVDIAETYREKLKELKKRAA